MLKLADIPKEHQVRLTTDDLHRLWAYWKSAIKEPELDYLFTAAIDSWDGKAPEDLETLKSHYAFLADKYPSEYIIMQQIHKVMATILLNLPEL